MYPTLGLETKYIIISKRHRLGRNLKVGDLIHTKHPNFRNQNAGKRVIGLPGDFVIRDPHMSPTVGGILVKGGHSSEDGTEREEPEMIEVPPGHVWIAGDNLAWSRDSRFYGPVPMGLILGKIVRHSNPSSDWIVDMVSSKGDQLRPARMGMEGDDFDDWILTARPWVGKEKATNLAEVELQKEGS
jgi:signal peptidase I